MFSSLSESYPLLRQIIVFIAVDLFKAIYGVLKPPENCSCLLKTKITIDGFKPTKNVNLNFFTSRCVRKN